MDMKRLIVIGAGAVGGSTGGLLAQSGLPVILIARGEHGEEIRSRGLTLKTPTRSWQLQPDCRIEIGQVDWQPGDVAMVATKLTEFESVLDDLIAVAGPSIPVVCATNGIHGEQWANARFENVASMLVWMPATHLVPGEVSLHSGMCLGVLDTGPSQGNRSANVSEYLCRRLRAAGFDARVRTDIASWKRAKWITNLGGAAQALVVDDWTVVAEAAQAEGERILGKSKLPSVSTRQLIERCRLVEEQPIEGEPRRGGSTWQSHQRRKPMESRWIEGAMADLADQLGEPAPVNRFLSNASLDPRPLLASDVLKG